jgi:molybdopterin molybdotransferase
MLSHREARHQVIATVTALLQERTLQSEKIALAEALGRVLSADIRADRDYPPFNRSTRDGFAVRAAGVGPAAGKLEIIGEVRAGEAWTAPVAEQQCVRIMTGAPLPADTDAVVMLEHAGGDEQRTAISQEVCAGLNVVPRGSEARAGQVLLPTGTRLGYGEVAIAAQVGAARVNVCRRPRVGILSTGDEVVNFDQAPGPQQIRNSNNLSLAAQAAQVGAEAVSLGNVPDRIDTLREAIVLGLKEDALVLCGGVSMGKYDLVETVLRDLGAQFAFDAVAIRPGRPAVFGICRGKPVFGLPGNPVSTMVTFELLVVPALDLLSGAAARPLPLLRARLARHVKEKPGLAHFVPARVHGEAGEPTVEQLPWQGSGDIVALARANCFLVIDQARLEMAATEWADVLPIRGAL